MLHKFSQEFPNAENNTSLCPNKCVNYFTSLLSPITDLDDCNYKSLIHPFHPVVILWVTWHEGSEFGFSSLTHTPMCVHTCTHVWMETFICGIWYGSLQKQEKAVIFQTSKIWGLLDLGAVIHGIFQNCVLWAGSGAAGNLFGMRVLVHHCLALPALKDGMQLNSSLFILSAWLCVHLCCVCISHILFLLHRT